ncbi:MAG: hypothetical protein ACE37N_07835 [Pseudohongiellaceae bacterium]
MAEAEFERSFYGPDKTGHFGPWWILSVALIAAVEDWQRCMRGCPERSGPLHASRYVCPSPLYMASDPRSWRSHHLKREDLNHTGAQQQPIAACWPAHGKPHYAEPVPPDVLPVDRCGAG